MRRVGEAQVRREPSRGSRALLMSCVVGDVALGCFALAFAPGLLRAQALDLFSTNPAWYSATEAGTRGVALGDVDADGDLDLVLGFEAEENALYLNSGGTFGEHPDWVSGQVETFCLPWDRANPLVGVSRR